MSTDKNKASRFNTDKVEFDTLPWLGVIEMAKVCQMGAAKYDKHNCKKQAQSSQYFNCKMRHALKHFLGEDFDLELKVFHLCQDAWNSLTEVEHIISGNIIDDRHKFDNLDTDKLFTLNDEQKEVIKKIKENKENKTDEPDKTKKYKLTTETKYGGLYRIKALKDFSDVKKGDLGGFIETEKNLSQEGDAWVYGNSKVYGDALVSDNALVCGDTRVYGDARVFGNAQVFGYALVSDNARVYGYALVYDNAWVYDNAQVYDDARVYDNARVYGNTEVSGDDWVHEGELK